MLHRHLVLAVAFSIGCATEPLAEDYDATCDAPEACRAVVDQGYCGRCDGWIALSADGAAQFEEDQDHYADVHHCQSTILIGCGDLPAAPLPTCEQNECALESAQ